MDVNAGRYNDGMEMDALGAETFELALDIASGQRSKGELAGHAQVSVWREWPRTSTAGLRELGDRPEPDGRPVPVREAPRRSPSPSTGCGRSGASPPTSSPS